MFSLRYVLISLLVVSYSLNAMQKPYTGAGVVPYAYNQSDNTVYILIGKENRGWSNFGGNWEANDYNNPRATAAREGAEELTFILDSDTSFANLLTTKAVSNSTTYATLLNAMHDEYMKKHTYQTKKGQATFFNYFVQIPYDESLPQKFKNRLTKFSKIPHEWHEFSELAWFKIQDVIDAAQQNFVIFPGNRQARGTFAKSLKNELDILEKVKQKFAAPPPAPKPAVPEPAVPDLTPLTTGLEKLKSALDMLGSALTKVSPLGPPPSIKFTKEIVTPGQRVQYKHANNIIEVGWIDVKVIQNFDAIVNAANKSLLGTGGLSGAIFQHGGGKALEDEVRKVLGTASAIEVGGARITPIPAGSQLARLGNKFIIHAVGPDCNIPGEKANWQKLLENAYANSLSLADRRNLTSIALPAISTAIFACPILEANNIAIDTVLRHLQGRTTLTHVLFFFISQNAWNAYVALLDQKLGIK